jgi:uncharacterized membrane protein YkoI
MNIGKRAYWVAALVAVLALAGAAVTLTSHFVAAGGSDTSTCDQQNEVKDGSSPDTGADDAGQLGDANNLDGTGEVEDGNSPDTSTDDAGEVADAPDNTNEVEDGSSPDTGADDANEADCADEAVAPAGTLDDGKDLLPQASISIDAAIAAAQTAASGELGEVDLEQYQGKLVFNVDVGGKDVKVEASNGSVLAATSDD